MLELVTALVGVALATTGAFLFISNRRANTVRYDWRRESVSGALLVAGIALLVGAMTLSPDNPRSPSNELAGMNLDELPATGAGPAPVKPQLVDGLELPYTRITVLAWGTPADDDSADATAIADYSAEIQEMGIHLLHAARPDADVQAISLTREQFTQLRDSSIQTANWCDRTDADLLVTVGVGVSKLRGQYTLWREPLYEVFDCDEQRGLREIGRADERPGDRFPYQLSLSEGMSSVLRGFASKN